MATDVSDRVREIARYREADESEIIRRAVETLWRDVVVSKYLGGDIAREEACEELGTDVVNRVDRAKAAIDEDVGWGLDGLSV